MGILLAVSSLAILAACRSEAGPPPPAASAPPVPSAAGSAPARTEINPRVLRRFRPLRQSLESEANPISEEKVALGRMLYFDRRLSLDEDVACNTCHRLDRYGADGRATSSGHKGKHGTRNSPSVYNAAGHAALFWDGRASSVEEQAKTPILSPAEMGMPSTAAVIQRLRAIPGYVEAFARAFPGEPDSLTYENLARSLGAFERKLVTPSRWDRYLAGDKNALSAMETEGLGMFTELGCSVCHTGELLGGQSYQRAGVVERWPNQEDQGRFKVTRNEADRMVFKVPSLRNVTQTAPYFHDGSAAKLEQAVQLMGKHQLGMDLTAGEVSAIIAFLGSLTGEIPKDLASEPTLPAGPSKS